MRPSAEAKEERDCAGDTRKARERETERRGRRREEGDRTDPDGPPREGREGTHCPPQREKMGIERRTRGEAKEKKAKLLVMCEASVQGQ